jgi:cellulose biosynthesis protein BcsQ
LAVRAADVVIAPVRCEALAMDGVAATLELVRAIGRPEQMIIVPTMVDERVVAQRYHLDLLRSAYRGMVAAPTPNRAAVAEAHAQGRTVWEVSERRGDLAKVRAAFEQIIDWLTTDGHEVLYGGRADHDTEPPSPSQSTHLA